MNPAQFNCIFIAYCAYRFAYHNILFAIFCIFCVLAMIYMHSPLDASGLAVWLGAPSPSPIRASGAVMLPNGRATESRRPPAARGQLAACQWLGLSETGAILRPRLSRRHSDHQSLALSISKPSANLPVSEFTAHGAAVGSGRRRIETLNRPGLTALHIFLTKWHPCKCASTVFFLLDLVASLPSLRWSILNWFSKNVIAIWILCSWRNCFRPIEFIRLNQCSTFDRCYAESFTNKQDRDTVHSFGLFNQKDDRYFVHTQIWYLCFLCVGIVLCSCSTHCGGSLGQLWN